MSIAQIIPVATEDNLFEVVAETELEPIRWQLLREIIRNEDGEFVRYGKFCFQISLQSNVKPAFRSTMTRDVADVTETVAQALGGSLAEDRAERYGEVWDSSYVARHAAAGYTALKSQMRANGIAG